MKTFEINLNPLELRAVGKIKFQGFALGVPYGPGELVIGPQIFLPGVDFDVNQSDQRAIMTLRDSIINRNCEFWADADIDNMVLTIFCKKLGAAGNQYKMSTTMNGAAIYLLNDGLADGKDYLYSEVFDIADIEDVDRLEFILNVWSIGADLTGRVKITLEQSIGNVALDPVNPLFQESAKQFSDVTYDANANLANNHQILTLTGTEFLGNKFRFKFEQSGDNVNSRLAISGLAN